MNIQQLGTSHPIFDFTDVKYPALFFSTLLPRELVSLIDLYSAHNRRYPFLKELKESISSIRYWPLNVPNIGIIHVRLDVGLSWWDYIRK